MIEIRSRNRLIENGVTSISRNAREIALQSLESALKSVNPKEILRSKLDIRGSCLNINGHSFDLKKFEHVYVVGGGKAGGGMAEAIEELLGACVTAGVVNVPHKTKAKTKIVELNEASHPIPDEFGVRGTNRMMEIADKADKQDLLICLLSGGGSSLMPCPMQGVSLSDKQGLTEALLKSGAPIDEINVVRKHLSCFKGGWLAKRACPATILNMVLSDVMGDSLSSIASGPTVPDPSTFGDAVKILHKYGLFEAAAPAIQRVLTDGSNGLIPETPKDGDPAFKNVFNLIIGNNRVACQAALGCLRRGGLNTTLVEKPLEGEASAAGRQLANMAQELSHECFDARPLAIVAGGETVVKVLGGGKGGRNQELVLSAMMSLKIGGGVAVASLSTDGVDGPTDAAGAIADNNSLMRAKSLKLNPQAFLDNNDSYSFFSRLDDLILTGPTGTNVNDITVIVLI